MQQLRISLKMLCLMIVLTGLIYPLFATLVFSITMSKKAGGSLILSENRVIGSKLIAQKFIGEAYFWPRPSAVDYNPAKPAGGSNLGPSSKKLKEQVEERIKTLGPKVPAELAYASGSGLDPHISLPAAYFQVERIANKRTVADQAQLRALIDSLAEGLGDQYVNVLLLNNALDQQFPVKTP